MFKIKIYNQILPYTDGIELYNSFYMGEATLLRECLKRIRGNIICLSEKCNEYEALYFFNRNTLYFKRHMFQLYAYAIVICFKKNDKKICYFRNRDINIIYRDDFIYEFMPYEIRNRYLSKYGEMREEINNKKKLI